MNETQAKKLRTQHLKVVVTVENFEANRTREMTETSEDLFFSGNPVIVRNLGDWSSINLKSMVVVGRIVRKTNV